MNRFAIALVACALALPAAASGAPARARDSRCRVSMLSEHRRALGTRAVARYHEFRRIERAQDWQIAAIAPQLPVPSKHERAELGAARRFRSDFRLPHDTRLLRALLRMKPPAVDPTGGGDGVPLTRLEQRDLDFRNRVTDAQAVVNRFRRYCSPEAYAGLWFFDKSDGVHVGVRFKGDAARLGRELARRFPFPALLHVLSARFGLAELLAIQNRIDDDDEAGQLAGMTIGSTYVDEQRNFVGVEVKPLSRQTRTRLRARYGPAVRALPYEVIQRT